MKSSASEPGLTILLKLQYLSCCTYNSNNTYSVHNTNNIFQYLSSLIIITVLTIFHVIDQTRGRVFPPISKHREVGR